jgi:hypothetical protein
MYYQDAIQRGVYATTNLLILSTWRRGELQQHKGMNHTCGSVPRGIKFQPLEVFDISLCSFFSLSFRATLHMSVLRSTR